MNFKIFVSMRPYIYIYLFFLIFFANLAKSYRAISC
jgi:hypothetical protein